MDIEKITLPNGETYNVKDSVAREQIATITSGIGGGMEYKGVTTTKLVDGSTETTIVINNSNYTPVNGDIVIYEDKEFIFATVGSTSTWHEFGSTGSLKALAFKDNASGSYTPKGTVSQPTFTGNQGNVSVSGAVNAKVDILMNAAPPIEGAAGSATHSAAYTYTKEFTPQAKAEGTAVTLNTASVKQITNIGTLPALTTTVSDETLILGWNAGSLPTADAVTVATSVKSVTQPKITVGTISYDYNDAIGTVTSTGTFTPSGSVSKPSFTGTPQTITVK